MNYLIEKILCPTQKLQRFINSKILIINKGSKLLCEYSINVTGKDSMLPETPVNSYFLKIWHLKVILIDN